jgi:regulator of protease activity HflC (stomatin/prohibitin superfamily)
MSEFHVVLIGGAVLVGFALLAGYLLGRIYIVREDEALMIQDLEKFKRGDKGGVRILWNPFESVIKGREAPLLEYPALDENRKPIKLQLRNARTGRIDLLNKICVPTAFPATTKDKRHLSVECFVEFNIDFGRLRDVYNHGRNFGLTLVTHIEAAIRAEFGMRNDQEVLSQQNMVENAVLAYLQNAEASNPLGVRYHKVTYRFTDVRQAMMAPAPAETGASQAAGATRPIRHPGVAWFDEEHFDTIGDLFQHRVEDRTHGLLAILEMQTRRDIAESLANSGKLIILTSDELGLTGGGVQLDAILKAIERKNSGNPDGGGTPPT